MELNQTNFNEANEIYGEDAGSPGENRLACVLLLDTSGSMVGAPIDALNRATNEFKAKTAMDDNALKMVDIAVIEFNTGARVVQDFVPLSQFNPVNLTASGQTSMGAGINLAIDKVKERNRFYNSMGTPCYKPWIVMITDGGPTDSITEAKKRIIEEESKGSHGKLKFWAIGVPGYNESVLKSLSKRCIALDDKTTCFDGFFDWLAESMVTISVSGIEENPKLPDLHDGAHVIPTSW